MDWLYDGVNKTVARNAGPECANFLSPRWRFIESVIVLCAVSLLFLWSYQKVTLPTQNYVKKDRIGKVILLILMSIVWGMEIGYKFSSRTVIYLLNPCHVTTAIQIYLLAAPPSKTVTAVFRFHLNLLNGPLLAFLFPETDSRILPLEASIYWIQHGIMFVVPYYLLRLGGPYNVEEFNDFSWNALSYSINVIYHFLILQTIAIPTEVNLNHMLCPAILDPFDGPYYRIFAVFHQAMLCPVLCKLFCFLSMFFLTKFWPTKVKNTLCCEIEITETNGDAIVDHEHTE